MLTPISQRANASSKHRAPKSYGKESVGLICWHGRTVRACCGMKKWKHRRIWTARSLNQKQNSTYVIVIELLWSVQCAHLAMSCLLSDQVFFPIKTLFVFWGWTNPISPPEWGIWLRPGQSATSCNYSVRRIRNGLFPLGLLSWQHRWRPHDFREVRQKQAESRSRDRGLQTLFEFLEPAILNYTIQYSTFLVYWGAEEES